MGKSMVVVGIVVTVGANDDVIVVVGDVCDDVVPSVVVVSGIVVVSLVVTVEGNVVVVFGSVVEVNKVVIASVWE